MLSAGSVSDSVHGSAKGLVSLYSLTNKRLLRQSCDRVKTSVRLILAKGNVLPKVGGSTKTSIRLKLAKGNIVEETGDKIKTGIRLQLAEGSVQEIGEALRLA